LLTLALSLMPLSSAESNFTFPSQEALSSPSPARLLNTLGYCGDGFLDTPNLGEECDDGNSLSGDGCSSTCAVEDVSGEWACATTNTHSVCTESSADDIWFGSLVCNDDSAQANSDTTGCTDDGTTVNAGYTCDVGVVGFIDTCYECCGDSIDSGTLGCDDGNLIDGDGCSSTCAIEGGYDCPQVLGGTTVCTELCLMGFADNDWGNFACKDGNDIPGDGCAADCTVETGFFCNGGSGDRADDCEESCLDIYDYHTYECDDGNGTENDGCDLYCEIEQAWWCNRGLPPEEPYLILGEDRLDGCFALCGDGEVAIGSGEICDDATPAAATTRNVHAGSA